MSDSYTVHVSVGIMGFSSTTAQSMMFRPGRAFSLGWVPDSATLEETFGDDVAIALKTAEAPRDG